MGKERYAYSREDETRMWIYLYEQLRKGVQAAWQPKGLEIWKMFALENVGRSADSLNTRFRKTMYNRLYDANLPCHVMMYLYLHYQIPMDSDVKTALELKFQIQIELKASGALKSFKRVPRVEVPRVQVGKSPLKTPPRQENSGPSNLHNEKSPSPSTERSPESLDFTRQIHEVERDSIRKLRLEELAACRDDTIVVEDSEDVEDTGETQSPAGIASHDDNQAQEVNEAHETPSQLSALQMAASTSNEAGQVEGSLCEPGQTPQSGEAIVANDVVVSTTSDSCLKALDRCFAAYGVENPSKEVNDWRTSEKVVFLTSKWDAKMREVVSSYKLTAEGIEGIIAAVSRKQKKLLLESRTESDYLRSLLSTKSAVKGELDRLSAKFRSPSPPRPFVKIPKEGFSFQIRNVYENVGVADREEAVNNIVTNHMSNSLHPAHIAATLKELEYAEELVAASSANKEDYAAKMKEVEDAVKKRVSAILKM